MAYGGLSNDSTNSDQASIQHVIYCIHGKPNGCCMSSDSELIDGLLNGSETSKHKRGDSLTATIGKS